MELKDSELKVREVNIKREIEDLNQLLCLQMLCYPYVIFLFKQKEMKKIRLIKNTWLNIVKYIS